MGENIVWRRVRGETRRKGKKGRKHFEEKGLKESVIWKAKNEEKARGRKKEKRDGER